MKLLQSSLQFITSEIWSLSSWNVTYAITQTRLPAFVLCPGTILTITISDLSPRTQRSGHSINTDEDLILLSFVDLFDPTGVGHRLWLVNNEEKTIRSIGQTSDHTTVTPLNNAAPCSILAFGWLTFNVNKTIHSWRTKANRFSQS